MGKNEILHVELSTDDVAAAKKFYKKIFDWKFTQMGEDMGNYLLIDTGSKNAGGGMTAKMSPNQPTAWLPYAEVKSVKKTLTKATSAGAKVMVPYQPIPGMGAIGVFIDPTGAALGIWEKGAPEKKSKGKKKGKK